MPHTQSLPEKLDLAKIEALLTTHWLGRGANELCKTIDSTNNRGMELASNGAPHGTIVIAEEQTAGRGRNGRIWYSPAGSGLYISFLLRPKMQTTSLPVITLITGVAAAQAIQKCLNIRPGLKWVNDLILDSKKIGGILCEYQNPFPHDKNGTPANRRGEASEPASERGNKKECGGGLHPPAKVLIVGIGLNVCPPKTNLPPDLNEKIGFLQSHLLANQNPIDRNNLTASITNELESAVDQMESGNLQSLLDQWRAYSITLGKEIIAQVGDKQITGQALDITDTGELIVITNSGKVILSAGEVSIRNANGSYI